MFTNFPVFLKCPALIHKLHTCDPLRNVGSSCANFVATIFHHFHPRRQRSTSTCSSSKGRKPGLAMIKPRSADRGIRLKVRSRKASTWGAFVEPTSAPSIAMMSGASIWATSRERRTCGKSTARSSPVSSKTRKSRWQVGWLFLLILNYAKIKHRPRRSAKQRIFNMLNQLELSKLPNKASSWFNRRRWRLFGVTKWECS